MLRLLTVVLLTGAVLGRYNFDDSYFNDLLLEDLRFHQGRPADQANLRLGDTLTFQCCDYLDKDNFNQLQLTQIVCYVESALLSDNKTRTRTERSLKDSIDAAMKQQFICAAECVARKEQIVDNSGNLLGSDVLIPFVTQYYADGIYSSDQINDFVNYCSTEAKNDQPDSKCNPAATDFGYCMWKKTQLNCPVERQDTSSACVNLRDKLMSLEAKRVIAR